MFEASKEIHASLGVDVEAALETLASTPISLHCWQGDDVRGFEGGGDPGGGLAVTGNYPGRARTIKELRQDLDQVYSMLPGRHRLNLHAIYGDFEGQKVDRDALGPEHYQSWVEWCRERRLGLDFNPSCFGHPMAETGLTLSSPDSAVREFWIEHCRRCRSIAAGFGEALGCPTVTNLWVPDGMKDQPVDRRAFRDRLAESLDLVFQEPLSPRHHLDSVECKLFGIGSEAFVVGSHEFYLGYAARNELLLCLDAGHFHPTEEIGDKISSVLQVVPGLLLHLSRGVRWDSDHVVILDDPTCGTMRELVACEGLSRTHVGLDFFDASINRVAAWVIGARAVQKALLAALLLPWEKLRAAEQSGDYTTRLLLFEQSKSLPWSPVWEEFCRRSEVPGELALPQAVQEYETRVLARRD